MVVFGLFAGDLEPQHRRRRDPAFRPGLDPGLDQRLAWRREPDVPSRGWHYSTMLSCRPGHAIRAIVCAIAVAAAAAAGSHVPCNRFC